ncbi:MAG TPA: hypothetical protein VHF22_06620 [Planctomycetota bacterium]|nr:hypothetical protein [Planctomycetota bacterium]
MSPNSATIKTADPKAQSFLGREFLTWLWFRCEADGGTFELPPRGAVEDAKKAKKKKDDEPEPDREVGVVFNDYVSLVSDGDEREENILKKGSPHRSAEARMALLVGKLVSAAKLEVARGERSWTVTLTGETLDFRSVKYPDAEGDEPEERSIDRLSAMQELGEIVDGLYGLFLGVRTSPDWDAKEVPAIARWIKKRAGTKAAE